MLEKEPNASSLVGGGDMERLAIRRKVEQLPSYHRGHREENTEGPLFPFSEIAASLCALCSLWFI